MKRTTTYRPWLAALLALLLLQVTVLRELHHLLDHHHDEAAHCDSKTAHFHSSEYAPVDCLICYFHFAPAEFDQADFALQTPAFTEGEVEFSYQKFHHGQLLWHNFLRGPPRLTA